MKQPAPRLPQALDYRDECEALHAVLAAAPAGAWALPTQFKRWTFDDVLGHLCMFDQAAEIAVRGREELQAILKPVAANLVAGKTFQQCTREWLQGCSGPALLVALVACMRKLLTILNAMAKTRTAFNPHHVHA